MKTDYTALEIAFEEFCDQFMLDVMNSRAGSNDYLVEFVSTMAQYLLDRDNPQFEMVIDEAALRAKDREFRAAVKEYAAKRSLKQSKKTKRGLKKPKATKKRKSYSPDRLPKEWGLVR